MNIQLHTFGCKVNTYDSGLIQKNLKTGGYQVEKESQLGNIEAPKIHVLNTCAVTAEATKEAVKLIRRIKAKSPFSTIVVTGCAAQVDTDSFSSLPGVDLVVANSHKGFLPQIMDQHFKGTLTEKVFKSNIFKKDDLEMEGGRESHHTRSFLKIQDGCNSFCSFCIIPYARGKSRSIPVKDLVQKIQSLESEGIKEVVLTGVHIGDYQDELSFSRYGQSNAPSQTKAPNQYGLEFLLSEILAQTKIPRIRLTSLEPIELSPELIALYKDTRLTPHFHMSIQSANTEVLKEMKRKYGQKEVIESLKMIQNKIPGAFVGMDVIAGFPTETEEQFLDTYYALAEAPWTRLHVFPYSERQGTKAEAMSVSVPKSVRSERAAKLRELSLHRYQAESLKQVGTYKKVLVQNKASKGGHGLSRDYWNVFIHKGPHSEENFDACALYANQEVDVKITGLDMTGSWMEAPLTAQVVEKPLSQAVLQSQAVLP